MVAAQYAEAVLDLAFKEGGEAQADAIQNDLRLINLILGADPRFEQILDHPAVPLDDKRKILLLTFTNKVKDLSLRLVELLLDKRRLNLLQPIEPQYRELLNKRKNILTASLVCADQLGEKAVADIKARLTEHLGRKLELSVDVDPSLIGGMVLRLGDQVIDGSLKGKLRSLERVLLSV